MFSTATATGCARWSRPTDHDMGCTEKSTPIGVLNEDPGELHLAFGSSAKTSDFIVDCLYA